MLIFRVALLIMMNKMTKAKINQQDYTKVKSFYIVKETINNKKRQPMELEKLFEKCYI